MKASEIFISRRRAIRPALCLLLTISLLGLSSFSSRPRQVAQAAPPPQEQAPETTHTLFTNSSSIAPADRTSNNAGTNPGLPALYPSSINVAGMTGTINKVVLHFQITSTFPDDLDLLLVGPTGVRSLVLSDAGGGQDVLGEGYHIDQTSVNIFPDEPGTPVSTGTYKPANYAGFATPEPGGADNFPAPAPGLLNYPTDFGVFNGTNPNGTWRLFVVDDQVTDTSSLGNGWSLEITTAPAGCAAKRPADMNGDGKTDYQVVRNVSGQINWFTLANGVFTATQFGLPGDFYLPVDYDGDGKADVAVWRGGNPAHYYILQSATNTLRIENFGLTGDNPGAIGDYDGDAKADPAVYRAGTASSQGIWFYKSSVNGTTPAVFWGNMGDFIAPGDYDGDGKNDFAVQRNVGGQGVFYRLLSGGGADGVAFGLPGDAVVTGHWDVDCKTDIAVARAGGGSILWFVLNSTNGQVRGFAFGNATGDFLTPGDYDGDGIYDLSVWRQNYNGTGQGYFFMINSSTNTFAAQNWGVTNDYPPVNYQQH